MMDALPQSVGVNEAERETDDASADNRPVSLHSNSSSESIESRDCGSGGLPFGVSDSVLMED